MKKANVVTSLQESWILMWKNPLSFFPAMYALIAPLVLITVIYVLAISLFGSELSAETTNLLGLASFTLLAFAALFLLIAHTVAVQISVMWTIAQKKSLKFVELIKQSKTMFWPAVRLSLTKLIISAPFLIAIFVIMIMINSASEGSIENTQLLVLLCVLFVMSLVLLGVGAWFVFTEPLLAQKKKVRSVLNRAWHLFTKDAKYVWKVTLTAVLIQFILSLTTNLISPFLPEQQIAFGSANILEMIFSFITTLILVMTNLIVLVWTTLFVYVSFVKRYA